MHTYHITILWTDGSTYSKCAPTQTAMSIGTLTDVLSNEYAGMFLSITVEEV